MERFKEVEKSVNNPVLSKLLGKYIDCFDMNGCEHLYMNRGVRSGETERDAAHVCTNVSGCANGIGWLVREMGDWVDKNGCA